MALDVVSSPPAFEDFTPLSEHHQQTPTTFFGAKPVLHLHSPHAEVRASQEDLEAHPALAALRGGVSTQGNDGAGPEDQVSIGGVDVWVTSQHLTLFSAERSCGVLIPYPSITIHAQEGSAVLLGLNLSDAHTADEDLVFVQLRIIPSGMEVHEQNGTDHQTNGDGAHTDTSSEGLFKAISDCQELNPDPPEKEDGFDETAPGATGWITSENMQDFMDENGEFRMPEGVTVIGDEDGGAGNGSNGLGDGAGRARTAAEIDAEDDGEDDTKWRRTG